MIRKTCPRDPENIYNFSRYLFLFLFNVTGNFKIFHTLTQLPTSITNLVPDVKTFLILVKKKLLSSSISSQFLFIASRSNDDYFLTFNFTFILNDHVRPDLESKFLPQMSWNFTVFVQSVYWSVLISSVRKSTKFFKMFYTLTQCGHFCRTLTPRVIKLKILVEVLMDLLNVKISFYSISPEVIIIFINYMQ